MNKQDLDKLTPEQKRARIAQACGWVSEPDRFYVDRLAWRKGDGRQMATCDLPDYLNDLNAMHEAEEILPPDKRAGYAGELDELLGGKLRDEADSPYSYAPLLKACFAMMHATAAQRAEAFLLTVG